MMSDQAMKALIDDFMREHRACGQQNCNSCPVIVTTELLATLIAKAVSEDRKESLSLVYDIIRDGGTDPIPSSAEITVLDLVQILQR